MKQVGRKLTLAVLVLLSVVLMLFGVSAVGIRKTVQAEDASAGSTTQEKGNFFTIDYSEDELTVLLSSGYRDYLAANRGDITVFTDAITAAVREIVIGSIFPENGASGAAMTLAWTPEDLPAEMPDFSDFDWGDAQRYMDYLTDHLSDTDNFDAFVDGEYDFLLKYAVSEYLSGKEFEDEQAEVEFYNKLDGAIQSIVDGAIQNMADRVFEENLANGDYAQQIQDKMAQGKTEEEAKQELKDDLNADLVAQVKEEREADKAIDKVNDVVQQASENGGKFDLSVMDLFRSIKGASFDGVAVYTPDGGISPSGLRHLLSIIPRPSEIAEMDDLTNLFSTWAELDTTFGTVDFRFTFGFYGEGRLIKETAAYIADIFDVVVDGHSVSVTADAPQLITKVFSKFLESPRFTDHQKNLVFSVFGMTPDYAVDKFESYTVEQLIDFLKRPDYQKWFANALNADVLNEYFGAYIHKVTDRTLTQEQIYRLVEKLYNFVIPKVETLQSMTVYEFEDWLSTNLPGFGTFTEKGRELAEKLLDSVKSVDWARFDVEYVKELVEDPSSKNLNEHIYHWIDRLAGSGVVAEYYDRFIGYAERLYDMLPDRLKDGTINGLYDGEKFAYSGSFTLDLERVFAKAESVLTNHGLDPFAELVSHVAAMIDRTQYDLDLYLELNVPDVYKVDYVVNGETVRAGFLPAGTTEGTVAVLSNRTAIDGYDILGWYDADAAPVDGKVVPVSGMPAKNVRLSPITDFELTAEAEGKSELSVTYAPDKQYTLTAAAKGVLYAQYTYEWYKDGALFDTTDPAALTLSEVKDSGEYTVKATDTVTGEVREATVSVTIAQQDVTVDLAWDYEAPFTYNGEMQTVALKDGWTADETLFTEPVYAENSMKDAGSYNATVTVALKDDANYKLVGEAQSTLEWKIEKFVIELSPLKYLSSPVPEVWENYTKSFVFNAAAQKVRVEVVGTLPDGNVVTNLTDEQTDAGAYTLTPVIGEAFTKNYAFKEEYTFSWTIDQFVIKLEGLVDAEGKAVAPFDYTGDEITVDVKIANEADLPENREDVLKVEGNTATDAGDYTVEVTLLDADNYKLEGETSYAWKINKVTATVDASKFALPADGYTYNHDEQTAELTYTGDFEDLLQITYEGNKQTDAGKDYHLTAKISLTQEAAKNYVLACEGKDNNEHFTSFENGVLTLEFDWEIKKAKLPSATTPEAWKNGFTFTYDGTTDFRSQVENAFGFKDDDRYQLLPFEYKKGETVVTELKDVGVYTAKGTITAKDPDNYEIENADSEGKVSYETTVNIQAQPDLLIDMQGVTWLVNGEPVDVPSFTYSGSKIEVSLSFPAGFAEENKTKIGAIKIAKDGAEVSEIVDAGTYNVHFEPATTPGVKNNNLIDFTITVAKKVITAQVTMPEAEREKKWTGEPIEFTVQVLSDDLDKIDYTPKTFTETNEGEHTKTITLSVKAEYANNYQLEKTQFDVTVKIVKDGGPVTPPEPEEGKKWTLGDVTVQEKEKGTVPEGYEAKAGTQPLTDAQQKAIKDAIEKKFGGKYDVKFGTAYDIHFEDAEGAEQTVNGKFIVRLPIPEELRSYPAERLAVIHIGDDASVEIVPGSTRDGDYMQFETDGFSLYLVVGFETATATTGGAGMTWLIVLLVLIAVLLLVALIVLIMFTVKVKVPEKVAAEQPAEVLAEPERPVEELTESEEPAAEEAPAEEAAAEQPAAEEAPAEEAAPAAPAVPFGVTAEEEELAPVVVPEEKMTVYDRSFTARLSQAEEPAPTYYNELKNYILSYKFVRSRVSWNYDSFNKGRDKIAKLQFKGKSLFLYVALDPDDLDPKFHHKSVADVAKYADVPTKLKVRSPRSLKYAKMLIDLVMEKFGIEQGDEIPNDIYKLPYKSTEQLTRDGEIKQKEVDAPAFWNMDAYDVIENSPALPEVTEEDLKLTEDEGSAETPEE